MVNCNPSRTPVDTESKLGPKGVPVQDPTLYRSLAGGLKEPHFAALKHILRYVRRNVDFGLQLSTSGYCVFLGDNLLSWCAKRQHTISRSSTEAEYQGVANVVAETAWVRNLLRELHSPLMTATLVYCDNVSAVYMSKNSASFTDIECAKTTGVEAVPVKSKAGPSVEALVQKLTYDKSSQNAIMDLALQFENACTTKDDLRNACEKCNDISQESRALINSFLKEGSDKDYETY
ncbi:ribonuclease H-like domain-containing protein [Tanacetum coccineum]